ncbi:unnamed protein product [Acanthoscelides obtectus]|uniref:Uncharacterized protein n=1 Tax=Acanthoscelides obtectus TaxID=200917 RepID=A0A9P0P8A2_ACAOB|nr:unnamed protein product [Acanthoscelides obtectus]CAK1625689.1 hypothetical protein AOBTE_LOCUS3335 [Acanthoscelides obtectus]
MNREDARRFFELLDEVLTKNGLMEKPSCIFNMDETGVQLLNKPSKVVTKKGSKDVHVLTSKERGENVTVIACCSADGTFIPPVLIFKGVNRKPVLSDGLPPGSKVNMNRKSSFINSELFVQWLVEQFIPHKPADDDEPLVKMIKKATSNAKVSNNTWTSDDDDKIPMKRAKNDGHDDNEYLCVECYEPYEQTTKKEDWLKCLKCQKWLHETCTMYGEVCNVCSRQKLCEKNTKYST